MKGSRMFFKDGTSSPMLGFLGVMALSGLLMLTGANNAYAACAGGTPNGIVSPPDEQCDDGNTSENDSCTNQCKTAVCGDGKVYNTGAGQEQCDLGTSVCVSGHSSTLSLPCASDAACNGVCAGGTLSGGPCTSNAQCPLSTCTLATCSGGNENQADTCRTNCKVPTCGDGITDSPENCDSGVSNSATCDGTVAGTQKCTPAACGDGYVNTAAGETCDTLGGANTSLCDGSGIGTEQCTAASCGDGYANSVAGETCDTLGGADTSLCDGAGAGAQKCTQRACGDTYANLSVGSPEECDSGATDAAGCNKSTTPDANDACKIPKCGDGYKNTPKGETCDDGNADNSDLCPDGVGGTCKVATCGDGFTCNGSGACNTGPSGGLEQCDDANTSNNDACINICKTAVCGDGFTRTGIEGCDDGNVNNNDACKTNCSAATCGDAIVQAVNGEQCDLGQSVCGSGSFNQFQPCSAHSQCKGTCSGGSNNGLSCVINSECPGGSCVNGPTVVGCTGTGNRDDQVNLCRSNCLPARCGDGVSGDGTEECDDGNAVNTDFCVITTPGAPVNTTNTGAKNCGYNDCGDTFSCTASSCASFGGIQPCDDGNAVANDSCGNTCVLPVCGDGLVQPGEQCDNGSNTGAANTCNPGCKKPFCGNGVVDNASPPTGNSETCDDANSNNNDACPTTCKNAVCGDGFVQTGSETCDAGGVNKCVGGTAPGNNCVADSQCGPNGKCLGVNGTCSLGCGIIGCGDGTVNGIEQCDDYGQDPGDGCDASCRSEVCGDGIVGYSFGATLEECDDDNNVSGDGCNSVCEDEFCGDGTVQTGLGEECENPLSDTGSNFCRTTCQLPSCGDGVKDTSVWPPLTYGEFCDPGAANSATCDGPSANTGEKCTVAACGDAYVNSAAGEECDDGGTPGPLPNNSNTLANACRTDCSAPSCGDGTVDGALGEQCDGLVGCTASCCTDGSTGFEAGFNGYSCSRPAVNACSLGSCSNVNKLNKLLTKADKRMAKSESKASLGKLDQAARQAASAAKTLGVFKEQAASGCTGATLTCANSTGDLLVDICLDTQANLVQNNQ